MAMSSETANKYFQGKENVAMAIARRRIKSGGDVKAALAPDADHQAGLRAYREMLEAEYPHLRRLIRARRVDRAGPRGIDLAAHRTRQ